MHSLLLIRSVDKGSLSPNPRQCQYLEPMASINAASSAGWHAGFGRRQVFHRANNVERMKYLAAAKPAPSRALVPNPEAIDSRDVTIGLFTRLFYPSVSEAQ
mgnify:CR=1 FL=1